LLPEVPGREHAHGWLFALADVGGHEKGEAASRSAAETMLAEFRRAGCGLCAGEMTAKNLTRGGLRSRKALA
jgi:hypothetical protein